MNDTGTGDELERKIKQSGDEAVKEQGDYLQAVIDSFPHPFIVVDVTDYRVVQANKKAAPQGDWQGTFCYSLFHARDTPCDSADHICPLREIKRTRKPVYVEHVHYDGNNGKRNVEVNAYPVFDKQGKLIQMVEYAVDITARKEVEEERERRIEKLQEAMDKVKILRGFLPICASCKKIRDDHDHWVPVEVYIKERSEAEFTHGICPECARKLYPGNVDT